MDLKTFAMIMGFYFFITYLALPGVFSLVVYIINYFFKTEINLYDSAGYGFTLGSVVSVVLWFIYGKKL